jgi:hypothetical protein
VEGAAHEEWWLSTSWRACRFSFLAVKKVS